MSNNNNSKIDVNKALSFLRAPARHGKYYVFTIPNIFIEAKEIDPNIIYKLTVRPIKFKSTSKQKNKTTKE